MIFSAGGVDFAIPDEWWAAAGMGIVAIIICIGFAMTSKSRLLKAGGYAFAAALMAVFAAFVVFASLENDSTARPYKIIGLLFVAAAGWAGRNAVRAYRGTGIDGGAK